MSEQDNVFPFGKFETTVGGEPDQRIMAVLNGVQHNLMMILQKIEILEHKVGELEYVERQRNHTN